MSANNVISDNQFGDYRKKVFDLKAEKLVRQAYDSFIYIKNYKLALKQINMVLEIEKNHTKALMLKGDILLCLDNENGALESYERAIESDMNCAQAYGSKAGVLDILGKSTEALECCNKAFKCITPKDKYLLMPLYDQKLSILHSLKRFEEAKIILKETIKVLAVEDSEYLYSCYQGVIENSPKNRTKKQETAPRMELQLVY